MGRIIAEIGDFLADQFRWIGVSFAGVSAIEFMNWAGMTESALSLERATAAAQAFFTFTDILWAFNFLALVASVTIRWFREHF